MTLNLTEIVSYSQAAASGQPLPSPSPTAANNLAAAPGIVAAPFVWHDPKTLPRRNWLYGNHYIGQFVTATIAPGGMGKSSLAATEAVAMATGRNLIGHAPSRKLNVWIFNGEDPSEELQRRITAIMLKYKIAPNEVEGRLFVTSGRDSELIIAQTERSGTTLMLPIVDKLVAQIVANKIDVLIVDPFISTHRVSENDNNAIDMVVKAYAKIAHQTGCSIELVHHARKTNGNETSVDDGRGASALIAATRSARTLNKMTKEEAKKAGIEAEDASDYVRINNGKANLTRASSKNWWFKLASEMLENGDSVGVVENWRWPETNTEFDEDMIANVIDVVSNGVYRQSKQSPEWVGHAIGRFFSCEKTTTLAAHKAAMVKIVDKLLEEGWLKIVEKPDEQRHKRTFIEVGRPLITIGSPAFSPFCVTASLGTDA